MKLCRCLLFLIAVAVLLPGIAAAQPGVKDYLWQGNLDIPDGTGEFVGATISVPPDADGFNIIEDVDVDLIIAHTWQGDLIVELEQVGGPRETLLYRPGDSANALGAGFSADNLGDPSTGMPMILDDEAGAFYDSAAPNGIGAIADPGIANVTGPWIPYAGPQPAATATLGAFDGLRKEGEWILWVSDNAGADPGSLLQFSLHITNQIPEPASAMLLALGGLVLVRLGRRRS